ncbi:MAG: TonB-dependent receptor [Saprospiraceae bacterium]|nr:MAG: TonB-dependent receptor [Saprospiraceae bacterium]
MLISFIFFTFSLGVPFQNVVLSSERKIDQPKLFTMYRNILALLLLLNLGILLPAANGQEQKKFSISGYVQDAQTGEKLIGVHVYDLKSMKGSSTNTYGFFSLTLPMDSVQLSASYVGFQTWEHALYLNKDMEFNIELASDVTLEAVEVTADAVEQVEEQVQMSRISVPVDQIKKLPAFLGENDVLKTLQLLPGVQSGGEGQSGLYVRGGSPDQNLILLDGVPVYNASHLFGFFSVFNSDALKDVNLVKGGFPARYGGRLSSVLEINMKEGNMKEWHGAGSISTVASRLTVEGPLIKDKASILLSGRRTYIDVLAKPFIKGSFNANGTKGDAGYYFHDFNAKVNYKFSNKDRLYLSAYTGKDKFYFREKDKDFDYNNTIKAGLGWGNLTTALRWNHLFGKKMFSNTTITYSRYKFNTQAEDESTYTENGQSEKEVFGVNYFAGINDLGAKIDFDYVPTPNHFIRFGLGGTYHTFNPGKFDNKNIIESENIHIDTTFGNPKVFGWEFAAYAEDEFSLGDRLKVNAGLHLSAFNVKDSWYTSLQPRFSARYLLPNNIALKASYAQMRQYIHLLSNEGIGLPTDLWVPTTNNVKPQDSWQVAAGLAKTFGGKYEVSLEGYYKQMKRVVSYKEGSSLLTFSDWENDITQGNGESYGMEFFVQKKKGRLTGWIGYTLSWTWRQFDEVNFGKKFPYKYDRRHDLSVVATYELSDRVQLSGTWVYGTGNAFTLGHSRFDAQLPSPFGNTQNYQVQHYENRNNYRMRAYHRLDVNIDFIKEKRWGTRTWSFGLYNAYSRQNPFFLYVDNEYAPNPDGVGSTIDRKLKQVSLFPVIPAIAYKFEF